METKQPSPSTSAQMEKPKPWNDGEHLVVGFPLCSLSVSALSKILAIQPQHWFEDGMGPATGFGCRLESGEMIFLEEFEYARQSFGTGASIYVEADSLVERGIEACVTTVLAGLALLPDSVDWVQNEQGLESARLVTSAAKARADKKCGA